MTRFAFCTCFPGMLLQLAIHAVQVTFIIYDTSQNIYYFRENYSMENTITILYDNKTALPGLASGWGFSCVIDYNGKRILFDTADNPDKLLSNLNSLHIPVSSIEYLVISHDHWDHTGGVEAILSLNPGITVYYPATFPDDFRTSLQQRDIKHVPVTELTEIIPGVSAGPLMFSNDPDEIPISISTVNGISIITGCAHPGILDIIERISSMFDKKIDLVAGGFHLSFYGGAEHILESFMKLKVQRAAPCHCTGDEAIELFADRFDPGFIRIGAGTIIEL